MLGFFYFAFFWRWLFKEQLLYDVSCKMDTSLTEVYLLQYCAVDYTFIPGGLNMGSASVTPTCPPRRAGGGSGSAEE